MLQLESFDRPYYVSQKIYTVDADWELTIVIFMTDLYDNAVVSFYYMVLSNKLSVYITSLLWSFV